MSNFYRATFATSLIALSLTMPAVAATKGAPMPITAAEVALAQQSWGEGIVAIGKAYTDKGDYRAAATKHINIFYGFKEGPVLFKPTKTSDDQFRGSFREALSYFVGGDQLEDKGFAITPWIKVRFANESTTSDRDSAMAMGNYYFTDTAGKETKVEYSFGYFRGKDGKLKINLHHSSVPYSH